MKNAVLALMTCCLTATLFVATPVSATDFEVDGGHSSLVFKVRHNNASNVYGLIGGIEGKLSYDAKNTADNAITMSAKPATIKTLVDGRDEHLRGPDFFNAREFPTMSFKSTKWEKGSEGKYKVTGDLTLLGVKKSITANVEHVGTNEDGEDGILIGFEATFKIDRSDFGMTYGGGGEVGITVSIEAGTGD